jgi:hypothetical protein
VLVGLLAWQHMAVTVAVAMQVMLDRMACFSHIGVLSRLTVSLSDFVLPP